MRYLLPLLLLLGGCGGCASTPTHGDLRAHTLRLEFAEGLCSGTAIGRDLILSAKHCFDSPLRMIDGRAARVVSSVAETKDTVVVRVSVTFDKWAKRGPRPIQGDKVRFWGNPQGVPDVYREAIVARAYTDGLILQTMVCGGDSGAGLWDERGRVVGIVSAVTGDRVCKFGLSL